MQKSGSQPLLTVYKSVETRLDREGTAKTWARDFVEGLGLAKIATPKTSKAILDLSLKVLLLIFYPSKKQTSTPTTTYQSFCSAKMKKVRATQENKEPIFSGAAKPRH